MPRLSHSCTQVGGYMFSFGGHNGIEYVKDMSMLNLGTSFFPALSSRN